MFEAQCRVLKIPWENRKRKLRDTLIFTIENGDFSTTLTANRENNVISYDRVKRMLIEKYSGKEYKRHLETKFRNLITDHTKEFPNFLWT